jgi:REP element-mobilizing transposase RayT
MCDGHPDGHRYNAGAEPWEGMCGGIAGTHNHASLPPAAHPAHASPITGSPCAVVRLTEIGQIAFRNWVDIPTHFPFVSLDEFVVMPDHLHGILCFRKPGYRERNLNSFGPQSQNLGSVIRNYKGATKTYATSRAIDFAWQERYHDDVITSGKELDKIRKYIRDNPAKWIEQNKQ